MSEGLQSLPNLARVVEVLLFYVSSTRPSGPQDHLPRSSWGITARAASDCDGLGPQNLPN